MWGQVLCSCVCCRRCRIIPTRVGTSFHGQDLHGPLRDHPHACGDKFLFLFHICRRLGSSPRVWGQAVDVTKYGVIYGIIPTRVGTRRISPPIAKYPRDHPHACGDKFYGLFNRLLRHGSSPRVWGQA